MNYVIIGASAAGITAAKTLRKLDKYSSITIVSKDEEVYSRCMLHLVIGGIRDTKGISFIEDDFFSKYNINWIKGTEVINLNVEDKIIVTKDDKSIAYDKLLIASGASSTIPPIEGLRECENVYVLRNIEDALQIKESLTKIKSAIIIGGGLVAIDAAYGLIEKGIKVKIVEMAPRILPLQLDEESSKVYKTEIIKHGGEIYTGVGVTKAIINESSMVQGVELRDGSIINGDIVIVAAGVRANTSFINEDSKKMNRGIIINSKCETSYKDVYAAGDVIGKIGIWPLAVKQATVAAYNMSGHEKYIDDEFGFKNSMNFFGVPSVSIGLINAPDDSYNVDIFKRGNVYKKIIHKDDVIYGAILQGDISYCGVLAELIKNKHSIQKINKNIFDIDYSDFFNIKRDGAFSY
ncbi:Pyridine nucleotide-disulphide oxidoreductase [Clostridium cavendishii DSM 21758]|uniref:Pyridine nucleotide-disulphide oxidoreductase n=1 Tax=Clostridium cavendishii DSM 21758 TaxID=1121302 RepID=A0A1M6UGR9_9CLOT|nr:FAD-dependent oxidoreductase [Clostridium cavendishii]SHK68422.1 Pyridine nucleotide-disulphide oxidoreductase [Clostridium cavendishii DSM 21758]